jgi:ribonucleoside-diphosphate reductase subunit M1
MYMSKTANGSTAVVPPNGVPTPSATPPPTSENKQLSAAPPVKESALASKPFKADIEEGDSPKLLSSDPTNSAPVEEEALSKPAIKQDEDSEDENAARDGDIYADAALACSIENKDACMMCSG